MYDIHATSQAGTGRRERFLDTEPKKEKIRAPYAERKKALCSDRRNILKVNKEEKERERGIKSREGRMKRVTCQEMRRISSVGHYTRGLCFTKNEGEREEDSERGKRWNERRNEKKMLRVCVAHTHTRLQRNSFTVSAGCARERGTGCGEGDPRWREREEPAAKG